MQYKSNSLFHSKLHLYWVKVVGRSGSDWEHQSQSSRVGVGAGGGGGGGSDQEHHIQQS